MTVLEQALAAIAFAFVILVVVLPAIAVFSLSMFDIVMRRDLGWAKLFWAIAILLIPIAGVILYWLARPTGYDPLEDAGEPWTYAVAGRSPLPQSRGYEEPVLLRPKTQIDEVGESLRAPSDRAA